MKFLLNMNMPRELCRFLNNQGHDCRHSGNIGLAKARDAEIIKEAELFEEIIITHDLDYGNLLAFSGESSPSVIIFRLKDTCIKNLFNRIVDTWPDIEKPLSKGAIIVIEDAAIRIRSLPIADNPA
jgi:predicted nuclease of predicted toxin-antitoxin system